MRRVGSSPLRRLAGAALVAAACAGPAGPPEIVVDRTACARCSMLISEPRFAAAQQPPDAPARVYDDAACLLADLADDRPAGVPERLWFRDAEGSGWLAGPAAVLVRRPDRRSPMGSGVVAFRDRPAATRAIAAGGGEIVTLAELRGAPVREPAR